jgi:hypothetical protein
VVAQLDLVRALELQRDGAGVRARRDAEVVFELSLVAVIDNVHALVDLRVAHARVGLDVRAPLRRVVADEVVCPALKLARPFGARAVVRAHEPHAKHLLNWQPLVLTN